ncbi:HET-domain-containing protein [Aspergillus uvarum CBS 121591]|uniref:HET-domain-containing protein n=1 Tax=Aspergillus uvarum CBS 121591 TaxID=1448315 RepID=A0A319BWA3_9EURO|nr:HET-domain-containing protein [Aspergillus uvarum CBS 121591]PYH77956.1 HET-domain-containing protein [Aspergillus uvarum CBS 121591]
MLQQQDCLRSLSYGKVLDRDWIDLTVVRQWLAHCTQSHGKLCSQHSWGIAIQPPKFLRVIDVYNLCLVEVARPEQCRFVALSYVWGRSTPLRLRYNNVDSMKRPQGLRQYMSSLPRTIIDAMEVVRGLDERYLWVDSLCILQGDSVEAREQIATMDRVYGSAFFTIVAAQGSDADHGLRGIKRYHFSFCEPGRPRNIDQPVAKIKDDAHIIAPFPSEASLTHTTWNTRAWTFQERILSKRILAFCGEEVVWHCRKMVCREDMQCEDSGYGPESLDWLSLKPQYFGEDVDALWVDGSLMTDRHGRTRVVRSGTFGQYSRMVEEYTSRHLTFESDAIRALEGLLHVFQLSFRSEFISGLPKSLLDVALLWRPMRQLQRRRGFPSWSWTGWKGQVSYNKAMESANRAYSGEEGTRSLQRWYTFSSSSSRLEPVNGHGWGVPLSRLPAEWEASLDCSTGRTGRTLTSDPLQLRSYVQATLGNRLLDGDMTYLILCTTCTRSFQLGNQILQDSDTETLTPHGPPIPPESRPLRFSIVASAFEWIGTVLLDGTGPEWMDKQTHEFILISEAQYFGLDDEPYNVGEFPLYHVMLVEHDRRTGISTRLGLGRVRKTAWMMAEPTERVVILG